MNLAIVLVTIACLFSINAVAYSSSQTSSVISRGIILAHHTYAYQYTYKKQPSYKRSTKGTKRYRSRPRGSLPRKRAATGGKVFIFSPRHLQWAAYDENGRMIKSGRASGGRHYCRDVNRACRTPRGSFRVYSRGGPGCKSSKFPIGRGGSPMPYCTFFYKGYAIHGSYNVPNYNASHGCIRVIPSAANWLSHNFLRNGTRVIVTSY